ncbi:MAG TPA: PaaI family thioesterase [Nocardioides sp.]|uniref:PaaI family thioesterase n=1 Tax=uncultured Nocardioides sp. TaxID=198441 RepID=UPI000EBBABD0|nr:PaaI family thioesterase [uncultured Nocardioides sp.]HCB04598.1 aromatic compound degradation protein PaaI [Nocardioides sp.]HRD60319.1 PaaI family thioesterase [Nocardioides sp.]HRI95572.1 PaaI family thioesterase [Nocardioides sp.]HRK46920.1 PaaI family thioesterase [Nocardioides sp.]
MSIDTRQRTYGWDDPAPTALAGLDRDGLSILRAIGAGELPVPPAVRTLGLEPIAADPGRASFRLDVGEYHLNPFGIVHGGVLAAMVDTAMGCAVHSMLPVGVGYVTGELNVRFLRPALVSGGPLICTAEVDHEGRTTMVASARIVDADGRVIALAGSTCLMRRP